MTSCQRGQVQYSIVHVVTTCFMQEGGGPTYGGVLLRATVPGVERLL